MVIFNTILNSTKKFKTKNQKQKHKITKMDEFVYIESYDFVSDCDSNSIMVQVKLDLNNQALRNKFIQIKQQIEQERLAQQPQLEEFLVEDQFKVTLAQAQELQQLIRTFNTYSKDISYKFYTLYGKKLVHYEFANFEMFNQKFVGDNHPQFGLTGALQRLQPDSICRYGRFWSGEAIALKDQTLGGLLEALNFYLILCRERLFSIRSCYMFMDNQLRIQFPYDYSYVGSLEDTTHLSLEYLSNRNIDSQQLNNMTRFCSVLRHKQTYYLGNKTYTDVCENVVLPFQYFLVSSEDDIQEISIILLHIQMKPQVSVRCFCMRSDINEIILKQFMEEFIRQIFGLTAKVEIVFEANAQGLLNSINNLIDKIEKTIFLNKQQFNMEALSHHLRNNDSLCLLPQDYISNSRTQYKALLKKFIPF